MEAGETSWLCGRNGVHISVLFPEVLVMIFTFLDVRDKGRVSQVCRKWRDAAYHRIVWRGVEAKLHLRRSCRPISLFQSLVKRGIKRVQVLSHVNLRRSLKEVINGIPEIESMNLRGCFNVTDTGLAHAFTKEIPSLSGLNLSLCKQVTDSSLSRISQSLKNLEVLELGGCSYITNGGLLFIAWGLEKLKFLNLRSCRHIGDQGISYLAGISPNQAAGNLKLEFLDLQDCQKLTDLSLKHVSTGFIHLKGVNLSFCGSVTDSGLRFLSKMLNLQDINLRSCDNISDIGIGYLAEGGSKITTLDVSFCERICDLSLVHMSQGLFHLKNLSLSACNISDEGLERLVTCLHELVMLNIGQCHRVTDKGLQLIAENLRGLNCIDLYGCTKITTIGLEHIMQLPGLKTLNLGLWQKR